MFTCCMAKKRYGRVILTKILIKTRNSDNDLKLY